MRAADADEPRSRAEVVAERDAAQAAGTIAAFCGEDSGAHHMAQQRWVSTRSRAEVVAELMGARRSGELAAMAGEDSGADYLLQQRAQPLNRYAGPSPGHDEAPSGRLAAANAAKRS